MQKDKDCIPDWSYAPTYYDGLTQDENVYIKTDPLRGKGLYARRPFKVGDTVLVETAMCCSQNVDDFVRKVPVCGQCVTSLESPKSIVARVSRKKELALKIPHLDVYRAKHKQVPCKFRDKGCSYTFCSWKCHNAAWSSWHSLLCRGKMTEEQAQAFDKFVSSPWTAEGIDYSDTHFLALRLVAVVLARHRLVGMPLPQAALPATQLISAPLQKFQFSYLLTDEAFAKQQFATGDALKDWANLAALKANPTAVPAVAAAQLEPPSKPDVLREGYELVQRIFLLSPDESALITPARWSELLGAVLLNGQERTPNSPYSECVDWIKKMSDGESEMKAYHRLLKDNGVDPNGCHTSARGQGVYTVGACFNHSCTPNLQIVYTHDNDEVLVATCIRDIEADEECFISYINEELSLCERQRQLYEHYLFECRCSRCVEDISALTKAPAVTIVPTAAMLLSPIDSNETTELAGEMPKARDSVSEHAPAPLQECVRTVEGQHEIEKNEASATPKTTNDEQNK